MISFSSKLILTSADYFVFDINSFFADFNYHKNKHKLMEKFYYLHKHCLKIKNTKKLELMYLLTKAILEAFSPQKIKN